MKYSTMSYNLELSKLVGVIPSIFLSFVDMNVNEGNEKVVLSRDYIFDRTGIPQDKQEIAEGILINVGVLERRKVRNSDTENYYGIDYDVLNSMDSSSISILEKSCKKKIVSNETKKEKTLKRLKSVVKVDDDELRGYIFDWIDSVIDGGKLLTVQSVKINVEQLLSFSNNKKDLIDVLLTATKNSWRDFSWVIDKKKKGVSDSSGRNFADYGSIKFSNESLSDVSF